MLCVWQPKKRGRKKNVPGASRLSPEVTRKLGEANLFYATGRFDEAVELLKEVVRLAPNVADSYHTLGLLYDAKGDRDKALNFYMIAAHLTPKDIVLWKRLASWSM
jgi:general transcription factor 3C polypeptide 3 (transcription factor C subunit 4)